jgi:hypothetical protein
VESFLIVKWLIINWLVWKMVEILRGWWLLVKKKISNCRRETTNIIGVGLEKLDEPLFLGFHK